MATISYEFWIKNYDPDGISEGTWDNSGTGPDTLTEQDDDNEFVVGDTLTHSELGDVEYLGVDQNGIVVLKVLSNGDIEGVTNENPADYVNQTYTISEVNTTICFMAGTMVTTPEGSKAVEELSVNDAVMTSDGEVSKVKFVGIQNIDKYTIPTNRLPVCIRQDALAPNVPNKDLYVSSDHAMYVDGILAQAGALVNGISINRVERNELEQNFTYYSVELEDHSLILADNTAAETFSDNATRTKFHNYKEYIELYGENENDNLTGELELPRAISKRQLPKAIKERLEERALTLFSDELSHTA